MIINFCEKGIMSTCSKSDCPKKQKNCFFFEKSSQHSGCMFHRNEDHCDSLSAQIARDTVVKTKNTVFI